MPQLDDCIRYVIRGGYSGDEHVLQVKRNGVWLDVKIVRENANDNSG